MAEGSFALVPGPEIRRVATALRDIDKALPAKLRKDLKAAAKPLVLQAKANAKAIPVATPDRRRLRKRIATGVGIQASSGKRTRIRITTRMPDSASAVIPRGLASPNGFRHPVFGNTNLWVVQTAARQNDWFMSAMDGGREEAMRNINRTLQEARDYIESMGGQG
jgi:hypothetical protein